MHFLRDFLQKYNEGGDDFSVWHRQKKTLQSRRSVIFKEREIWWCSVGINVGYEVDGKGQDFARPVLVLKKVSNENFIGLPITSVKKDLPGYFEYKDHYINGSFIFE
ncbi:MAG: type II toxin-antitoxin system PemK/MazF family toxin [Candidatus Spechtbacteria bacterium SB0662_bin_43]|uniref:Type II toxin-antitoxin system PemK/MazF family toxin n=1 Tax=Candidatus Spechtbacteria bacterium SB0662_bin_43 TaxID=2604897 RepID=A0A845DCX5_9BACT|nr:type II toxin-antitoxin system PemK/MazF family toxin [Candidatus Spechtbacteria bacterium SB0662_bin_43]